jgi:hypothetical protein
VPPHHPCQQHLNSISAADFAGKKSPDPISEVP